jgi:hypothetical protein
VTGHFPLKRVEQDGDFQILDTWIGPDQIGRSRVVCRIPIRSTRAPRSHPGLLLAQAQRPGSTSQKIFGRCLASGLINPHLEELAE